MAISLEGYEGPRSIRPQEHEAVRELSRSIFFPGRPPSQDGPRTWPMGLHPDFRANSLAIFHEGQPVSTIGSLERDVLLYGARLRLSYIGGVCTHPDHRKRGLAGALLSASFQRFREHGVDFAYISGTRPLYYAAGANHIGGFSLFTVPPGALVGGPAVALRQATPEDAPLLCRLNERDGLHMARTPGDYELLLQPGYCAGRPCQFLIVEMDGVPAGYLFGWSLEKEGERLLRVLEVRGERLAILSALGLLAWGAGEGSRVQVEVPQGDLLEALLRTRGMVGEPGRTPGTVKVLDFCGAMTKLRPYLASRLGAELAASLRFLDAGSRYLMLADGGAFTIDGETNLLWTLLGAPAGETASGVTATGSLSDLSERCLPLPLPSVYLNLI
jgi:predicted N-acetyltransferase YhbS